MARADQELLKAALFGYQVQRERLEATIADIQAELGHRGPGRPKAATDGIQKASPAKRTIARWAAYRKAKAKG